MKKAYVLVFNTNFASRRKFVEVLDECKTVLIWRYDLRDENSIIPESDLSFDSTAAPEIQLRSLLCACISNTTVQPKSCVILSGIIKPSSLSNGIYIISENSAHEIAKEIERQVGTGPGRFLLLEYTSNSQGRLTDESWHLLNNKYIKPVA